MMVCVYVVMYQEGAEHIETDEVDDCKATAACLLPARVIVRL